MDVYKWESIEDVIQVMKEIRQGKHGKTYNKLDMTIIQEAMSKHLDKKAALREKQHHNIKKVSQEEIKEIDYEKYKARMKKESAEKVNKEKEEKRRAFKEVEFLQFKEKYKNSKK